ncbi:unnamed protein product, partial [Prorocentrum cordatum]
ADSWSRKTDVRAIEHFVANKAVSKALARVHAPMRFTQGDDVPRNLQDMFPKPARPLPPQPAHEKVPPELLEELVTHISAAVAALPSMCGAGPNGSFYEHLKIHASIQGGQQVLASVLADLLTGEAPLEANRARLLSWTVTSTFAHWCHHLATGVLRSEGGPVACRHFVDAHLFSDPELTLTALDVANMYGSMCLGNIESEGCPSASYLACLGVAPVHDALKENSVVVRLQLHPEASRVLNVVSGGLRRGGSGIRRVASPPLVLKQPLARPGVDSASDPALLFTSGPCEEVLAERRRTLNRFSELKAAGLATHLDVCLARVATASDGVYLQQRQPPTEAHCSALDMVVLDGIFDLLGVGYGLSSAALGSKPNYLASWLRDLTESAETTGLAGGSALLDRAPALRACLEGVVTGMSAQGVDLPTGTKDVLLPGSAGAASRWLSEVVSRIGSDIRSGATEECVTTMLESDGGGGGSCFAVPTLPHHCLTNQEVATASRLQMHLEVHEKRPGHDFHCLHRGGRQSGYQVRSQAVDLKGLQGLMCKRWGLVVGRHDALRDVLAGMITEQVDIDYHDKRMVRQCLDVAVVTPHIRALPWDARLHRAGALIAREESNKRRKYHMLSLTPFVLSHLGRMGGGGQGRIKAFADGLSERERSSAIDGCYQHLAATLQRGSVALLAAAAPLIP